MMNGVGATVPTLPADGGIIIALLQNSTETSADQTACTVSDGLASQVQIR